MNITLKLPPKPWWKSKAIWAAVLSAAVGVYEVAQSYRPELPKVSDALYLFLASFGVYGLRMARRPIDAAPMQELPPQPAPPAVTLPDASLTGLYPAPSFADDAPLDTGR